MTPLEWIAVRTEEPSLPGGVGGATASTWVMTEEAGGVAPALRLTSTLAVRGAIPVRPPSVEGKIEPLPTAPALGSGVDAEAAMVVGVAGSVAGFGSLSLLNSVLIKLGIMSTTVACCAATGRAGTATRARSARER